MSPFSSSTSKPTGPFGNKNKEKRGVTKNKASGSDASTTSIVKEKKKKSPKKKYQTWLSRAEGRWYHFKNNDEIAKGGGIL